MVENIVSFTSQIQHLPYKSFGFQKKKKTHTGVLGCQTSRETVFVDFEKKKNCVGYSCHVIVLSGRTI